MREQEFTWVVDGPVEGEPVLDKLYDVGCSDAAIGSVDGIGYLDFYRKAKPFSNAVLSAIREVESVPGLTVLRDRAGRPRDPGGDRRAARP